MLKNYFDPTIIVFFKDLLVQAQYMFELSSNVTWSSKVHFNVLSYFKFLLNGNVHITQYYSF